MWEQAKAVLAEVDWVPHMTTPQWLLVGFIAVLLVLYVALLLIHLQHYRALQRYLRKVQHQNTWLPVDEDADNRANEWFRAREPDRWRKGGD